MNEDTKQEIASAILKASEGNPRLSELLTYSFGRICLNVAKRGDDWKSQITEKDYKHISDWLKTAIINDEPWLSNVDSVNRPKKLMKFSTFKDIVRRSS